jgi:hypothetical protein
VFLTDRSKKIDKIKNGKRRDWDISGKCKQKWKSIEIMYNAILDCISCKWQWNQDKEHHFYKHMKIPDLLSDQKYYSTDGEWLLSYKTKKVISRWYSRLWG